MGGGVAVEYRTYDLFYTQAGTVAQLYAVSYDTFSFPVKNKSASCLNVSVLLLCKSKCATCVNRLVLLV